MKIFITILVFFLFSGIATMAQTAGLLTVSTTTSSTGGNFAPRNIVAIWVENEQGEFVKTLLAYAQARKTHLNTWQAITTAAGTAFNTTDAVTGATRSSHGTRECTWDATDYNGNAVADGAYFVWMELTDKNATGNYSSFEFTKGENPENLTPQNVPSFASIDINWQPTGVSVFEVSKNTIKVLSKGNGNYTVNGDNIKEIEVMSIAGKVISKSTTQYINISSQPSGIYLLVIKTGSTRVIKKIYKN